MRAKRVHALVIAEALRQSGLYHAALSIELSRRNDSFSISCPRCGAPEVNPLDGTLFIRALKIFDDRGAWSQCLVCSGGYGISNRKLEFSQAHHAEHLGWFVL